MVIYRVEYEDVVACGYQRVGIMSAVFPRTVVAKRIKLIERVG